MHYKRLKTHGSPDPRKAYWTDVQVENLRRIYAEYPPPKMLPPQKQMEAIIGHPMKAITSKAQKMGFTSGQRQTCPRQIPDKICPVCLIAYQPTSDDQVCCSRSCGQKANRARNGHPRGMAGKQHTDATKERLRQTTTERWRNATPAERERMVAGVRAAEPYRRNENTYSRTKSGKRADLDGLYVRSAWEANYARYLNWRLSHGDIRSWEYEPRTFDFPVKRGNRSYTPDFLVVLPDGSTEWHEVKGWMDDNSRVRLDRFSRYFPDETLVLIDEPVYRSIARDASSLIDGWES